jgi:hypothetical protein
LAWSTPISQEWGKTYGRFIEDTETMIKRGGGEQKVDVQSYGGNSFRHFGLHLDRLGGERNEEAQVVTSVTTAKFSVNTRTENAWGILDVRCILVTGGSEENARFYQATPGGEIVLVGLQPEVTQQFTPGKQF